MRRTSATEVRTSTHNGTLYEFTRIVDYYADYAWVELIARVWTGYQWQRIHHWSGRK